MRYSFRLAELLGHVPDTRKRPGTIKAIVDYTGLDRHQVAALLRNEVKYIPLAALSRLCDYLIEHCHVAAEQLPGALFAVEPENFWELLARRKRLELCLGVRREEEARVPEAAWVVASDSVLLGELLNGVSTLGGSAKHGGLTPRRSPGVQGSGPAVAAAAAVKPHPEHLAQSLVWSPGQGSDEMVVARAREVHAAFADSGGDKALVCLGSIKSNPVVELVLAEAFGCEPFKSQDDAASARRRHVPFFLRYREYDPHPDSCSGGLSLARAEPTLEPGFYYEQADGDWTHCDWRQAEQDVALVFYLHRESHGRLEMVLGGYSGRATRLLARTLATRAEDFWPPIYSGQGVQVGAFIVRYSFGPQDDQQRDILRTDLVADTTIIPLPPEPFARRLGAQGENG